MEKVSMPETPDNYELAARMKYMEGKTWAQIAKALSLKRGSVDHIKKKLRRDMLKALKIIAIMNER
jgi:DNA-directed RNA polymerase specialized sigma24 family protein